MLNEAFFGTHAQRALLKRARALRDMLRDDAALTYYGRTLGLLRPPSGDYTQIARLVAVQGASNISNVPSTEVAQTCEDLSALGISTTVYDTWNGGDTVLSRAARVLVEADLPDDLTLVRIDDASSEADLATFADVLMVCGVLPLVGSVVRGTSQPGVGFMVVDAAGKAVSAAASAAFAHRSDPDHGGTAWWGALSTDPARRGERLSLILGAHAIQDMHHRFGFVRFMTGVQPGNAPSEAVCQRIGLERSDRAIITCVDAAALPGGKMTK